MTIKVDIIGGGIGGLCSATSIRERDKSINVILHEKYSKIGFNHEGRRCGEAHSVEAEWAKWKPVGKSVFNEIIIGESIIGKKKHVIHRKPGTSCMLNRQEFICQLARKAEKLGVTIQTGDKIKSVNDLDGDFIIDASGCPSVVKRELGFTKGIKGVTYQQTLEDSNCFISDTLKVFFSGSFGYFWIFPRNPEKKEVNVGVGFIGLVPFNLKKILEDFKEKHDIKGKINYVTGGLIPIGLQKPLMYDNILFVGDAGVGTFPFTGQGIYRALMSGDIAARCIANKCPNKYPYKINQAFIKWDIIGKLFTYMNYAFRRIGPDPVLDSFNFFINFYEMIH